MQVILTYFHPQAGIVQNWEPPKERTARLRTILNNSALFQQINYIKKRKPVLSWHDTNKTTLIRAVRHKNKVLQLNCKAQLIHGVIPHILPVFSEL